MVVMALSEINGTYSRINVKNAQAGVHCREWHPIHLHPGLSCHQLFQLIGWYLEAAIIVINMLFFKYILTIYIMNNRCTSPWEMQL